MRTQTSYPDLFKGMQDYLHSKVESNSKLHAGDVVKWAGPADKTYYGKVLSLSGNTIRDYLYVQQYEYDSCGTKVRPVGDKQEMRLYDVEKVSAGTFPRIDNTDDAVNKASAWFRDSVLGSTSQDDN